MKKSLLLVAGLALVACNQTKIGYVDLNEVVEAYKPKKSLQEKFESKNERFNKKRDSLAQAFKLEEQVLQTRVQSLSPQRANEEIGLYQQKTNFVAQQLQQEMQTMQNQVQQELDSLVKDVKSQIENYGKTQGYHYIFSKSENAGVLYGIEESNLTEALIKYLNKE